MRTATDRGIINTKSWGEAALNRLPEAPVTAEMEAVRLLYRAYAKREPLRQERAFTDERRDPPGG